MKQIVLVTLKMKFLYKNFHPIVQIGDKNWTLVPQNLHLVIKKGKFCTFYTKNEVFARKFDPIAQIGG